MTNATTNNMCEAGETTRRLFLDNHHIQSMTGLSRVYHQLTNIGETPLRLLYCYGPAGDVAHWRQELDGTLPKAGSDVPPLPPGAHPLP